MRRLGLMFVLLLLASCSTPTPTPTPTATATSTPRATDTPLPTATLTQTATLMPTTTPTSTATPVPTYTLSGIVFFDYNGNGVHDTNEPTISGATVQVGNLVATTDASGNYISRGVPKGNQQVRLSAPDFRYISLSLAAFQPSDQPISVTIDGDTKRDWGLMQGFLTMPFSCTSHPEAQSFVDLDQSDGIMDWRGQRQTYNLHSGTDFVIAEGTPVHAAAPGLIISAEDDWERDSMLAIPGNRVIVHHDGFRTVYNHLKQLAPNIQRIKIEDGRAKLERGQLQFVQRGQPIGYVGITGNNPPGNVPHLHFEVNRPPWQTRGMYYDGKKGGWASGEVIDPYRWSGSSALPSQYASSFSLWTKDNDPQCIP